MLDLRLRGPVAAFRNWVPGRVQGPAAGAHISRAFGH